MANVHVENESKDVAKSRLDNYVNSVLDPESSSAMMETYDEWAQVYDEDLDVCTHNKYKAVEKMMTLLNIGNNARVLDLGAGTGLIGEAIYNNGFHNLDAIDASPGMLKVAEAKNIYKRIICDFVGANRLDIADEEYDAIVGVGCLLYSHIKEDCYEELLRITKPGGHIIFLISLEHIEHTRNIYEGKMDRLEEEGLWIKKEVKMVPNYLGDREGICFVLQKC